MSKINKAELKERIKTIRESCNLKKVHFANRLGISCSYVADLEAGKRNKISLILSKLISYEFNINDTWLLTGEGEMFSDSISIQNMDETSSEILGILKSMNEENKQDVLKLIKEKQLLIDIADFLENNRK